MLVTYQSGDEILVTTKEQEAQMKSDYFGLAGGRDFDHYDREEHEEPILILARLWIK